MARPVEKERSVMDRVRAGELTLADITPVKVGAPERASEFAKETEVEAPREERAATRREERRAAREEERPEIEEATAQEEKPAKRNLASVPVKSDEFDIAFEEAGAPVQKSEKKKKKGSDEDFLF
ncbi:MAG: hypothetical protein WC350_01020 [Candidatus Micrarchaeia archaeon]|jgi:hypothetical protein